MPSPNMAAAKWSSVPFRCAIVRSLVDGEPFDLVKTGVWVASSSSVRNIRPGADHIDRRLPRRAACGPAPARCAYAAPGRTPRTRRRTCPAWSAAGWSGPMLRASKFSHSASTSGPSATSYPIATKTSADPFLDRRQRVPGTPRATVPGQGDVDGLLDQDAFVALGLQLNRLRGGDRLADVAPRSARPAGRHPCGPAVAGRRSPGWPAPAASGRRRGRAGPPSARRGRSAAAIASSASAAHRPPRPDAAR